MKRALTIITLGIVLTLMVGPAYAYESLQGLTEVHYWDEANAYNGYTLFAARGTTYLIDMEGYVVHTWPIGTNPRLLDNGNLLDASTDDPSGFDGFQELDWHGNIIWQYNESREGYDPHHDFVRIYNTELMTYTTLYIANKTLTHAECIAAGCDPANGPYDGAQMDAVVEVDMAGNVVWEWWFFDHAAQDIDPAKNNYVANIADALGRINLNLPGRPVRRDWLHCNSLDYNEALGQIVINSVQGEFYVIDHDGTFLPGDPSGSIALAATSAGDFLYRFGDPARYQQGDPPSILEDWTTSTAGNKQIGGSHDIHWIDAGLPGAGHFLVFNNGQYLFERTPQSYIFEINGFLDAVGSDTGDYVNPPDAGYYTWTFPKDTHKASKLASNQIVWMYYSQSNQGFFSHIGSSAQRLPNGNTLICADTEGHVFEVTASGELVWEYINPVTNDGIVELLPDNTPMTNGIFRAYRYAADHPAFADHEMTPGDTITGRTPDYLTPQGTEPGDDTWTMLALPDTGQTGDYTLLWGEDSDYTINPPAYTDNGDGTVTDQVTGLTWQQADNGEMTWENAVAACSALTLVGRDDWRLPYSHELFSILDHGRANPALNTTYFTTTGNPQYWWAAEVQIGDATKAWAANAGGGIGPHPKSETASAGGTRYFHVRCVRGAQGSVIGDFEDNGDGTVTDHHTGLVWQQGETAAMTWETALTTCESLSLAGSTNWRLPNVKELRSISDESRSNPSVDTTYFPNAAAARYWSSSTHLNIPTEAWSVNFQFGLVSHDLKTGVEAARCVRSDGAPPSAPPQVVPIPAGVFSMGDHHNLGGGEHSNDEVPTHTVAIDAFSMATTETTNAQYAAYLNSALTQDLIEVRDGAVYGAGADALYYETGTVVEYGEIAWDGHTFSVLNGRENHPVVGVRWEGAAAYTNWLSVQQGYAGCYDPATWECDFSKKGYRLPTEAEWEYAGRGGLHDPYTIFPWGDIADETRANWPNSGDPYEAGDYPWTTPVGFYNGDLRQKADFNWPGSQTSYQTVDGSNGYGLYDMAGNVWEWTYDLYNRDYYSVSAYANPTGPVTGTLMPDGQAYHTLRGGNWYNGEWGHSRVSNRNPAYYRGPDDPHHAWYHSGFRVVLDTVAQVEQPTLFINEFMAASTSGEPSVTQTVGLFQNNAGAYVGYTLIAPKHYTTTYLIDNEGRVVNSWKSNYVPGQSAYLLENGHLLRAAMISGGLTGGGEGGRIEEYDWDGNLVWAFNYATNSYTSHHDIAPLPNGHILLLVVEKKPYAEVLAAGFNPALLNPAVQQMGYLLPDSIVEIEPVGANSINVVWEWHVWDHLVQDFAPTKDNYGVVADHPELVDPNRSIGDGPDIRQFWNHMNAIDYNAEFDQIVLSVRGSSELWVIDHSTTSAEAAGHTGGNQGHGGDLLYRWGNPQTYDAGGDDDQMLFDQHDVQWIKDGNPGAGHMLIFNNGIGRNYSTVDEIIPPVDASGAYTLPTGAAYGPAGLAWTYVANPPDSLYSEAISGAERLPNGNTLLCDGVHGVLTEVTPAGEIVWQYVNPVVNTGPLMQGESPALDVRGHQYNAVFKVRRYSPDYPAFADQDMTPGDSIELYPSASDWIELYNPGPTAVAMDGLYLTDNLNQPTQFRIPDGVTIPARSFLLFHTDRNPGLGDTHTNFELDAAGEAIGFFAADGITLLDGYTFGLQTEGVSEGRYPDGGSAWTFFDSPTPGESNTLYSLEVFSIYLPVVIKY